MQPLSAGRPNNVGEEGHTPQASPRLLLPPSLRKWARRFRRINWRLPSNAGVKGALALFLTTGLAGVVLGGHALTVAAAVTTWFGLSIQEIKITGQSDASEVEILDRLGIGRFPSLLTFDLETARSRVEDLSWIETATLTKLFPNTLLVAVSERAPAGIWQNNGVVYLVDDEGAIIAEGLRDRYRELPYVVGPRAADRMDEFIRLIAAVPALSDRIRAGMLISERRWTLVLKRGIELLLPQEDPETALRRIAALDTDTALLSREIAAVDFRFADKVIVRLTDRGIAERKSLLESRAADAKRRRTST